jgi:hypothetical protein
MSGDHGGPRSATWILRMAAANDAIGDLVAAMARQIALPGPDADGALAAARAAYEAATGSPADDALLSIYQPDAMAVACRLPRPGRSEGMQSNDVAQSMPGTTMVSRQFFGRQPATDLIYPPRPGHRRARRQDS